MKSFSIVLCDFVVLMLVIYDVFFRACFVLTLCDSIRIRTWISWVVPRAHRHETVQVAYGGTLKHICQSCYAAVWFWCFQYTKRHSIFESVNVFPSCIFCKRCPLVALNKRQWTYSRCISYMTCRFLRRTREALKQTSLRHNPSVSVSVSVLCYFLSYCSIWIVFDAVNIWKISG